MPRFELHISGTPDRKGVNPFTKATILIPGRKEKRLFWEIEVVGASILQCDGTSDAASRQRRQKLSSQEAAEQQAQLLAQKKRRRGYEPAGPSRVLVLPETEPRASGSTLLVQEYFAAGDGRFLEELFACTSDKMLATFGARFHADPRPFAREALLAYIDDGCDRAGHRPLVKQLFKGAEAAGDDEAMGHFMVAFDAMGTRKLGRRGRPRVVALVANPFLPDKSPPGAAFPRFSRRTRRYLARRSWRYFRRLGHGKNSARCGPALRTALALYDDVRLSTAERILDAWGLLHALYGRSKVLVFHPRGVRLAEGRALRELEPAPAFPLGDFDDLLVLLAHARSRTVRVWAVALLERDYRERFAGVPLAHVRVLLASPHEEAQTLGARLFQHAAGVDALPIEEWLALLRLPNVEAVVLVCAAFAKHVSPKRLSLEGVVELASAKVAAVADLGVAWAKEKGVRSEADLSVALRAARGGVESARAAAAAWLADVIATSTFARAEHARDLADAQHADVRARALACIDATPKFADDASLWLALAESPYDDVRSAVLRRAQGWSKGASAGSLRLLYATALLAVHGGSRAKAVAARQLAARVADHGDEAELLLPLLGQMFRSIRPAERRAAVAALARAAVAAPDLRGAIARHVPELTIGTAVTQ